MKLYLHVAIWKKMVVRKWHFEVMQPEKRRGTDSESFLLELFKLSITLLRTARGSKDTSDFKHFKTLIKSLKVLLPFYFLLSQPLFSLPLLLLLLLLLSLRYNSAHFRHQTRLKQIRAKTNEQQLPAQTLAR